MMISCLRKAMFPLAVAVAMAASFGALGGPTSVRTASALNGDICQLLLPGEPNFDGQGNEVRPVPKDERVTLLFRLQDEVGANVEVQVDSESGSARITGRAEIFTFEDGAANVGFANVIPGSGTQVVDTIDPLNFNDSDGHPVDDIAEWYQLEFGGDSGDFVKENGANAGSVCGGSASDGWGTIEFECLEAGYFHLNILPPGDTEETGLSLKFYCGGQADTATIAVSHSTVETQPTYVLPNGTGTSTVTVTVEDQLGDRLDGVDVTLTTDNCTFMGHEEGLLGADSSYISPVGGGQTVTIRTDTDVEPHDNKDFQFLQDNPLEHSAGTAEAVLDCTTSKGAPGVAHITAIVQRPGSDIVLSTTVTVVGPTSATGLTLTLTPEDIECGEVVLATISAVDANGAPVSDGTPVHFTTDTSSGVVSGTEGAQGTVDTLAGQATVHIATDPGNPGIHTVIAYIENDAGTPSAQDAATYHCDAAVAPAAPTVAAPATGTGTGSITPPNTGDAGLASGTTSASLFVIVGAVFALMAGVVAFRPHHGKKGTD